MRRENAKNAHAPLGGNRLTSGVDESYVTLSFFACEKLIERKLDVVGIRLWFFSKDIE